MEPIAREHDEPPAGPKAQQRLMDMAESRVGIAPGDVDPTEKGGFIRMSDGWQAGVRRSFKVAASCWVTTDAGKEMPEQFGPAMRPFIEMRLDADNACEDRKQAGSGRGLEHFITALHHAAFAIAAPMLSGVENC